MKKIKGFTLLELIVVIAIIGILVAIIVPSINEYMFLARLRSSNSQAQEVYNAAQTYLRQLETQGRKAEDYFGYDSSTGLGYLGVEYSLSDAPGYMSGADSASQNQKIYRADIKNVCKNNGAAIMPDTPGTSDLDYKPVVAANFIANQLDASFDGAFFVAIYPKTYTVAYVLYVDANGSYSDLEDAVNNYGCYSEMFGTALGTQEYGARYENSDYVGQYPLPCDIDDLKSVSLNPAM